MVKEIDIRYCSSCQTRDFVRFVKYLFFSEDQGVNTGCPGSSIYRNSVTYSGLTTQTPSQTSTAYSNTLYNRFHEDALEFFNPPSLDINFYAGNGSYGFVDRTFIGSANSLIHVFPFQISAPPAFGFNSYTYEEYIIDNAIEADTSGLVRSRKVVGSSDRMHAVFGLVKPLVATGSILYSTRDDSNVHVTYTSERMDISAKKFKVGNVSGTPALFYVREMSMRKLFILQPNVLYKTTLLPGDNLETIDGVFDRDLYLPPYLHTFGPSSLAETQSFYTDEVSKFQITANNTAIWSCVPVYSSPVVPDRNRSYFKLKDVYRVLGDVSEFEIYPYEVTFDMKMNLDNKLKYGAI